MRSLSDLCIPDAVHDYLRQRGWGILRANVFALIGQPDENVWACARRENRVLLSADNDFHDDRAYPLNGHPGCIMLTTMRGKREGENVIDLNRWTRPHRAAATWICRSIRSDER